MLVHRFLKIVPRISIPTLCFITPSKQLFSTHPTTKIEPSSQPLQILKEALEQQKSATNTTMQSNHPIPENEKFDVQFDRLVTQFEQSNNQLNEHQLQAVSDYFFASTIHYKDKYPIFEAHLSSYRSKQIRTPFVTSYYIQLTRHFFHFKFWADILKQQPQLVETYPKPIHSMIKSFRIFVIYFFKYFSLRCHQISLQTHELSMLQTYLIQMMNYLFEHPVATVSKLTDESLFSFDFPMKDMLAVLYSYDLKQVIPLLFLKNKVHVMDFDLHLKGECSNCKNNSFRGMPYYGIFSKFLAYFYETKEETCKQLLLKKLSQLSSTSCSYVAEVVYQVLHDFLYLASPNEFDRTFFEQMKQELQSITKWESKIWNIWILILVKYLPFNDSSAEVFTLFQAFETQPALQNQLLSTFLYAANPSPEHVDRQLLAHISAIISSDGNVTPSILKQFYIMQIHTDNFKEMDEAQLMNVFQTRLGRVKIQLPMMLIPSQHAFPNSYFSTIFCFICHPLKYIKSSIVQKADMSALITLFHQCQQQNANHPDFHNPIIYCEMFSSCDRVADEATFLKAIQLFVQHQVQPNKEVLTCLTGFLGYKLLNKGDSIVVELVKSFIDIPDLVYDSQLFSFLLAFFEKAEEWQSILRVYDIIRTQHVSDAPQQWKPYFTQRNVNVLLRAMEIKAVPQDSILELLDFILSIPSLTLNTFNLCKIMKIIIQWESDVYLQVHNQLMKNHSSAMAHMRQNPRQLKLITKYWNRIQGGSASL